MSDILKQVYKMVLDEDFEYSSFEKRLKLQKTIYLLESIGIHIGNYGFSWYKHGPYSQELQDDAYYANGIQEQVNLSGDAQKKIEIIKSYIAECEGTNYSKAKWLEDIASLYYLKFRTKVKEEELLNSLKEAKPHLENDKLNKRALEIIDQINKLVA